MSFSALQNFDMELQDFYKSVIDKELDITKKWHAVRVRRDLKEVVKAYQKKTVLNNESFIRYDTPSKRCAYLLKHSYCFTSAVAYYMNDMLQQNHKLISKSLGKGELSICCLGGGPASDAVGVIRIIRHLYEPYFYKNGQKSLKLNVCVVDLSEDWQVTAINLLESLKTSTAIIGNNMIDLFYCFYTADLTKPFDTDVKKAIFQADIITMIYFISAVNGSKDSDKSQSMMERIILNMRKGAILFFLDSAADHHYRVLHDATKTRRTVKEIYGPLSEEFHTLSLASVQKFLDLYARHFNRLVCMTNIFLAVSVWHKPSMKTKKVIIKNSLIVESSIWQKPSDEESDELTRVMKAYRATIQKLASKYNFNYDSNKSVQRKDDFNKSMNSGLYHNGKNNSLFV